MPLPTDPHETIRRKKGARCDDDVHHCLSGTGLLGPAEEEKHPSHATASLCSVGEPKPGDLSSRQSAHHVAQFVLCLVGLLVRSATWAHH